MAERIRLSTRQVYYADGTWENAALQLFAKGASVQSTAKRLNKSVDDIMSLFASIWERMPKKRGKT